MRREPKLLCFRIIIIIIIVRTIYEQKHPYATIDFNSVTTVKCVSATTFSVRVSKSVSKEDLDNNGNELSQRLVRYCSVEAATLEGVVCCR